MTVAIARRAGVLVWLCGLSATSTFAPYVPEPVLPDKLGWLLGLASHWQWAYAGLAVLGAALALGLSSGRRRHVLAPLGLVVVAWFHQSPGASAPEHADAVSVRLTVASANLNLERMTHEALTDWLLSAQGPDVIALQEFTASAMAAVNSPEVLNLYPHRVLVPSSDPFGLGVLSKLPMTSAEAVSPAHALATLKLRLVLDVQGRAVAMTTVHPMPPISPAYMRERDASLHLEARRLAESGTPGILLGDFNDTPWSTGLRATAPMQRANGLTPTWPNAWGRVSVLPLDHVLVTPGIRVEEAALGPDLGSDHRPVRVRLVLP